MAPRRRPCSRETSFLHHRRCIVERTAEAAHHLVDFGLGDDQRRAEGHIIARHVAQYRPADLRRVDEIRRDTGFRSETLLRQGISRWRNWPNPPDVAPLPGA